MNVQQMRARLREFYGATWKTQVDNMSDYQIIAIFRKFQKEGRIK